MNKGFNNPTHWANKIYSRARKAGAGSPHRSIFNGDPIEVDESAGVALTNPALVEAVLPAAAEGTTPQLAAEYTELSPLDKQEVTVLPALIVSNALMIISPNTRAIPADNVNYNFNRCLTDYASRGYSLQMGTEASTPGQVNSGEATVTFNDTILNQLGLLPPDEVGRYKTVPAFKFTLTASVLRTRPGGQYSISVEGTTVGEINVDPTDKIYTFQRIDYTTAVTGIYIPFIIIATRTVAALLKYGNPTGASADRPKSAAVAFDPDADISFIVKATGLAEDETLIVEVPGYTTAMTSLFCTLYGLTAGKYVK